LELGSFLAGFVAVGLTMWVEVARVVTWWVISGMQYVTAACFGALGSNYFFNHIQYHGASYCYFIATPHQLY
jgi:hypothetical protein